MGEPDPVLIVTTASVAGHRIAETLGYLEGSDPSELRARAMAMEGANAVVGVQWATRRQRTEHPERVKITGGPVSGEPREQVVMRETWQEVSFVYGTAVAIKRETA